MTLEVSIRHRLGSFELDVTFAAPPGITVLFGRSGSGKTTIVNAVAGLLRPTTGRITVDDRVLLDTARAIALPAHRRRLGYVFQEARLFPHLSVQQNLVYGARFAPEGPAASELDRIVELLGLSQLLARRPALLSGGERQRVAIGRALLSKPLMLLADEPLASLDEARKLEVLPYFEKLNAELSMPILYVSHSPAEVARLAKTVVALQNGRVIGQGAAREVLRDPMVMPLGVQAVGAVISARVVAQHADGLTELDAAGARLFVPKVEASSGDHLRLRIAAHEVILARTKPDGLSALNILEGTVSQVRSGEGPGAIVSVDVAPGTVLARITQRSVQALGLAPDVKCYAIIKAVGLAPADVSVGDILGPGL